MAAHFSKGILICSIDHYKKPFKKYTVSQYFIGFYSHIHMVTIQIIYIYIYVESILKSIVKYYSIMYYSYIRVDHPSQPLFIKRKKRLCLHPRPACFPTLAATDPPPSTCRRTHSPRRPSRPPCTDNMEPYKLRHWRRRRMQDGRVWKMRGVEVTFLR